MTKELQDRCLELIRKEVVPATGCTEPVAVALAAARASKQLSSEATVVDIYLSANMLKNAMGVGIPGTGMIGLPIAVALGLILANPEKELSVLDAFTKEELARAKEIVDSKRIRIQHKLGNVDKLYIEVNLEDAEDNKVSVIIEGDHRNICFVQHNDNIIVDNRKKTKSQELSTSAEEDELALNFDLVYRFATETPLERIEFITQAVELNRTIAEYSLNSSLGHEVGRVIKSEEGRRFMGDTVFTDMLIYTGAACDARMDGAPLAVMSNSGSGNQGITATLPVWAFAHREDSSFEATVRALTLSSLMVIYIKQKLGRLSALCGCVVAATGSSCGITYLMGGTKLQITYAIKNMVGNITGMLCDGAKPSCSMKVSSGVSSAMLSALLAMKNQVVTAQEGIVDNDVDKTIDNLTAIGRESMNETDKLVLEIMTTK